MCSFVSLSLITQMTRGEWMCLKKLCGWRQPTYGSCASLCIHVDIFPTLCADAIDTVCFDVVLIRELGLASLPVLFFLTYFKNNDSIQECSWYIATLVVPSPLERCVNGPTSNTHRGDKINRSKDRKQCFPHINLTPCL